MYLGTVYVSTKFSPNQTWLPGGHLGKQIKSYYSLTNGIRTSNEDTILKQVICTDQTWSFIRHGKLINLTGLYTKVRPHIHLSLNKLGRPKLTQNEHKIKKNRTNYYRYNRIKAKINP
jgi:hypothetical protein